MASNEFKKLLISEGNSFVSWVGSPNFADQELTYSFETALRGYYLDSDTGGLFLGGFVDPSSSGEYCNPAKRISACRLL
ncbi:MAG: hypothetical protein ACK4NR_10880 [Micavibrio sp.]